ncbi:MAG: aldo/keto reductase [Thermoguttaceae bacterium]|nr:aldo/keto reductase [Thermoguttaceae bacterium]MDW8038742.1 aldo/keto reductase [Thermoguttaceae bacterium]
MKYTRRDFLASALAAGASGVLGRAVGGQLEVGVSARPKITSGTDRVPLGRTGLKPTVLGIGTGTRGGSEQLALGQEGFVRLFRHAYERGIRYIDTADMYSMHLFVRFAIQGLPRDQLFILTKTMAKHPEVAKADIERFRRELRTDYLDCVLMHCMTTKNFPVDMRPVMDVLTEAKQKGRVRAIGISSHGMDPLLASVDCDWIEVQLIRINPFGQNMDGKPDEVLPICKKIHATGRGVLGMKIYGETGYESREKRLQALRYVLQSGAVDAFTIGFRTTEQIDETLELIREALST